jgi:hypothetical protein
MLSPVSSSVLIYKADYAAKKNNIILFSPNFFFLYFLCPALVSEKVTVWPDTSYAAFWMVVQIKHTVRNVTKITESIRANNFILITHVYDNGNEYRNKIRLIRIWSLAHGEKAGRSLYFILILCTQLKTGQLLSLYVPKWITWKYCLV